MFGYIYKKDVAIIAAVLCLCLGVGSFFAVSYTHLTLPTT